MGSLLPGSTGDCGGTQHTHSDPARGEGARVLTPTPRHCIRADEGCQPEGREGPGVRGWRLSRRGSWQLDRKPEVAERAMARG